MGSGQIFDKDGGFIHADGGEDTEEDFQERKAERKEFNKSMKKMRDEALSQADALSRAESKKDELLSDLPKLLEELSAHQLTDFHSGNSPADSVAFQGVVAAQGMTARLDAMDSLSYEPTRPGKFIFGEAAGLTIKVSCNRRCEEDRRIPRLYSMLGYIYAYNTGKRCLHTVDSVHDHKGTLTVHWKTNPPAAWKKLFDKAWLDSVVGDFADSEVHHYIV